ncbi:DNA methyltransferase [Alteromonas sp. A079]|uniref:DNA methyltransferase n=1 Tax=Alteromonas sp. A079 TaxID=3410268 RepID=UPI003BA382CB
MPLTWNEIKSRALSFSIEWIDEVSEQSEAKTFWDEFFHIFGIDRKRVASFENHVKKHDGKDGFIDLLWKGVMLVEHKSKGKSLEKAKEQAFDYFVGLKDRDLPRYVVVSDFARFRLYDLEEDTYNEFSLEKLHENVYLFGFMAGYTTKALREQKTVDIHASESMGKLYKQLTKIGYKGHALSLYLVRLLFCMFADNTGIFDRQQFRIYLEDRTAEDGSDLSSYLNELFYILNTPTSERLTNLDEQKMAFRHINGRLFEESLPLASFDSDMRQLLLDCSALDWSQISPAIFGSLFQSVQNSESRREQGSHYTSEENILKLLEPLFLEGLKKEFKHSRDVKNKLLNFLDKLSKLKFFDPACGCGNFLVVAYREIRILEMEAIQVLSNNGWLEADVITMFKVNIDQFYGIEIEEFPTQIARVAMWLIDHQMNLVASVKFGFYLARIPLRNSSTIVHANALLTDWEDVIQSSEVSYILGNPPFSGAKEVSKNKNKAKDRATVVGGIKNYGLLDYVAAWYVKSAEYINKNKSIVCSFVTTNSLVQGEQPGIIWDWLFTQGIQIHFAHRAFPWSNEAKGKAGVHCVIVGFGAPTSSPKLLFDYSDTGEFPVKTVASNINPYLIDFKNLTLKRRSKPISDVPKLKIGNKPIDDGNYIFSDKEKALFIEKEPKSEVYFRPYIGAEEFINGGCRWFLWLGDCPPNELKKMPLAKKIVSSVKKYRSKSSSIPTQKLANFPTRLHVENFPEENYLVIPEVSSERREFIPIGFEVPNTMCSNLVKIMPTSDLYHFGILTSTMHNAWTRAVCGRLESRYRYSSNIVFNSYPWPENPNAPQQESIRKAAKEVLDIRKLYVKETLADLYDPDSMPVDLKKAHIKLDKVVDKVYTTKKFNLEKERVEFLFELYENLLH